MARLEWMVSIMFVSASACSAGAPEDPTNPDGGGTQPGRPDGGSGSDWDADPTEPDAGAPLPQECVVPTAGFGAAGALTVTAQSAPISMMMGAPVGVFAYGNLDQTATPDELAIELYPGYGVFMAGALTTGTFQLTGAETSYADCGACLFISGDIDATGRKGMWMASGGTLTLTSVTGTLTGSVANVSFIHVDLADGATPLGDSCDTTITSGSFSGAITPAM